MKNKTYLIILLVLYTGTAFTQSPKPVYSIVKQLKSYEWYVEQAGLWKQEISNDSLNSEAWYNYYIANRMANLTGKPEKWETQKDKVLEDLSSIVANMERLIPESFEFNHAKWWNGGNNFDLLPYLEKAYEIDPSRYETYDDFITYYEVNRNKEQLDKFCKLWYTSDDVSPGILNWNYNTLMSLEENAIIFTAGDNDTYPIWILQYAKGVRKDVTVMNTSLIFIEEYRKSLLEELDIIPFTKDVDSFYTDGIKESGDYQLAYNNFQKAIINHIIKNSGEKPVYFGSSVQERLYGPYEENLYLEGLAFKYSEYRYDNMAILKRNVEQKFLLDYLIVDLNNDISKSVVEHSNFNYMMAFIRLYDHYKISGDNNKAEWIKGLAQNIANSKSDNSNIMQQFE